MSIAASESAARAYAPTSVEHEPLLDMRVLVVDDNPANVQLLEAVLARGGYRQVRSVLDPDPLPELIAGFQPDLILLDIHMPGRSGLEILQSLRQPASDDPDVAVIVITADTSRHVRHQALEAGARDFITKPIDGVELLLRVRTQLSNRYLQRICQCRNAVLDEAVRERTEELEAARLESLRILASVAEYHDDDTAEHTQRVGVLSSLIATELGQPDAYVAMLRNAAPLHDLGKIAISRPVLVTPGPLSPGQRAEMMRHVDLGAKMLESARSPVLQMAREIALSHHERWDGEGYLVGLAGEVIPLAARITAVADVYDALTHPRPYKDAWPRERALAEIADQAGRHFDPQVTAALLELAQRALI